MKSSGKVILVGAGAGNASLVSRAGYQRLREADVVVTDRLLDPQILSGIGPEKIYYVGKAGGTQSIEQNQINDLLIRLAREGKTVVRIKGGDPLIFGRGGEELEGLTQAGVDFQIVPGITAASVASAFAGIPLTHRDLTSTVCFVTGHEDPSKEISAIDYPALAKMGTIVWYMAVASMQPRLESLISAGLDPATPAAVIERAGSGRQRTITATVKNLAETAERQDVRTPALVIVGKVVKLRDKLSWFENQPLFGKTIVLTRPTERMESWYRRLTDLGAQVLAVPTIELIDVDDYTQIDHALHHENYDWLVLTSPKTVEIVLSRLKDARKLARFKLAVIGEGTAAKLRSCFIQPDLQPQTFTSKTLTDALIEQGVVDQKVLLLRAEWADQTMAHRLTAAGAKVTQHIAYRTRYIESIDPMTLERLRAVKTVDYVVFTSSSTVRGFYKLMEKYDLSEQIASTRRIAIGPVTADQMTKLALPPHAQAENQTLDTIIDILQSL